MTYHKHKSTGNKSRFNSNSKSKNSSSSNKYKSNSKNKNFSNNNNNSKQNKYSNNKFDGERSSRNTEYSNNYSQNSNGRPNMPARVKPTAEENKQFAIKGNYNPNNKSKNKKSFESSQDSRPPRRSNNRFNENNIKSENFKSNNSRQILLNRYDKNFGIGTSRKLQDSIRLYSQNQFIRVNLSKMSIDEAEKFLVKNRVKYEKTFLNNAFKIEKSFFNLSSSLPCLTGQIYFQDLASQVPVNCVDFDKLKKISDGGNVVKVLDGCASPGSKTTQMLDLLNYHKINYELIAIELEQVRINRLINNIQKMGFSGFKVVNCSATDFKISDKFDVIILDVPCSGNLVGDKNWLNKRNVADICAKSDLQKSIVKNISKYLAENGELVYSTCSIEVEENENNVKWIVENCNLKNIKVDLNTPFDSECLDSVLGLRFLPHKSRTQGFFVAKFLNK